MGQRIASLDVIRGFALFGVLAINAPYFAAPVASVVNPSLGPLAVDATTAWSWALPYVLFEYKSVALFSMLFGASLFLVGGERGDPQRSSALRRRLAWLAAFGVLHGVVLWFGDILLSYAIAGFLVMGSRSWTSAKLMKVGLSLFGLSLLVFGGFAGLILRMSTAELAVFAMQSWAPPASQITGEIARYHAGAAAVFTANLSSWVEGQVQTILLLTARTAGLMMIGLALFKSGFLTGDAEQRLYRRWLTVGALSLAVLAWNGWDIVRLGFPLVRTQAIGTVLTATLAPLVSIGYASALILILRARRLRFVTAALASVGRMAFTNYLAQSIVLGLIFWSGRGLGFYGQVSRPVLAAIATSLFLVQLAFSSYWMKRFGQGPFEKMWRRLSRPSKRRAALATHFASSGAAPAVETAGLSKNFGAHRAVADVNLHVPAGSIYAFLGPNGAGKTSTIRMLLGLMRPTAGTVRVFGTDVSTERLTAARHIGALLEARATYDHLTGRENLEITRRLLSLPAAEVDRVLAMVGLEAAAGRNVGQYSLGMRQRLGLARSLLGRPRLLILDEPMNGLDPEGIAEMRETIRALPDAAGVTVFLSSHLLAEVEQVASHIGLMRQGRLIAQEPLAGLLSKAPADLFVRTDADRRARQVLLQAGLATKTESGGILIPAQGGGDDVARVARLLIGAGVGLLELTPRRVDLEALYMNWTQKEEAA